MPTLEHRERSCSVQASSTAIGPVDGNDQPRRPDAGPHLADPALREVVLVSPRDIPRLGFENGEVVEGRALGRRRRSEGCMVSVFSPTAPRGPGGRETNPPVPLGSFGEASHTPTSKFVAIKAMKIEKQTERNL